MTSSIGRNVRIQIASDLHLEFYGTPEKIPLDIIEPSAPILALLGDIGLACTELLRSFLLQQCDRFEHVLFVAGNHEFYNEHRQTKTVQEQLEWIRGVCGERANLHFLERETLTIGGVRLLGTSLWSYIPPESVQEAEQTMNDYRISYIQDESGTKRRMDAKFTNAWHIQSLMWLREEIEKAKKEKCPLIVLTHHTPSKEGTSNPKYNGSSIGCCFSSNLTHWLCDPVKVWACGHTHYNFDGMVGGTTRLVSNQRGYPSRVNETYDSRGIVISVFPVAIF